MVDTGLAHSKEMVDLGLTLPRMSLKTESLPWILVIAKLRTVHWGMLSLPLDSDIPLELCLHKARPGNSRCPHCCGSTAVKTSPDIHGLYHPLGLALWQSTPLTYSKRKVPLLSGAHQQCVKCLTGYSTVSTGYQWILSSRELTFVSFNYLKPNLWSMPSWNLQFDRGTYMNQEQWGWYP